METVQLPPQAGQTVASAHAIFGPRLIGACLYGSATLRGLRPVGRITEKRHLRLKGGGGVFQSDFARDPIESVNQ